jgi:hypothetical protein
MRNSENGHLQGRGARETSIKGKSFLFAPTLESLLPFLEHRAEFPQFLNQGQSVGLLGRVISSSQGLYIKGKAIPVTVPGGQ